MPVIVSLLFLHWKGYDVNVAMGAWALVTIIVFQAASNAWSDYFDFKNGVDTADTFGSRTLTDHLLTPRQDLSLAVALNVMGIMSGLAMTYVTGMSLLWIGLAGALCSILYPYLKYHALGDVAIAIAYALLPAMGTSFVAIGVIDWQTLLLVLPVGLITVAILHANNTRDISSDRSAGISTLSMALGESLSFKLYAALILSAPLFIAVYVGLGILPLWSLLTLLSLPMIASNLKSPLVNLDERTAKLQLVFSVLLSISFLI